jgi:crossover junction endodeoxyribonuclease RuvC
VDAGVIRVPSELPLWERVEPIFRALSALLTEHRPELVFVESVFHHRSAQSALILGHARGVALLAARLSLCTVKELAPAEIKKAVTGNGRAEKSQVQSMVKVLLRLGEERLPLDASDALAIAIAGCQRSASPLADMIDASKKRTRGLPPAFRRTRPTREGRE